MKFVRKSRLTLSLVMMAVMMISIISVACSGETEVVEVKVPGETVIQEVVKEVQVPGETVIKEVVKEVKVPGETVIKEVVKEVKVPGETIVVDMDPGKLVLYSGRKESLVGNIVTMFEEATGIDVEVKYGKTFPVATMILEEGDNSPADIYWAQDPGGLGFLSAEGRLRELPEDITGRVSDWAKPSDGTWIGLSGRARTLVHTASIDSSELPSSLEDLTDPKWKGKLGWAPTNSSFQTMITGMRALWGEDKTRAWLEAMLDNEPIIYPKNTPQVAGAAAEEISIGLVNHYYLHRFVAAEGTEFNAANLYLSNGGPGSLVMVAGAGIVDTAENVDNAEKFLRFMTTTVAQQYFNGQIYEYPVIPEGVNVHKFLPSFSELNTPSLSMEDLSDLEGTQKIFQELGMLD